MTGEQLDDQSGNLEKAVEEGSGDDAAPVSGDEPGERGRAFGLVGVPVPVGGTASNAEVD